MLARLSSIIKLGIVSAYASLYSIDISQYAHRPSSCHYTQQISLRSQFARLLQRARSN